MIRAKACILGASLVYGPLAEDDDRWSAVLQGVRSGEPAWLHVAVDLKPALDTHPGEEMLGAVSIAIDRNPIGAIEILLPAYGPAMVCAEDDEGSPISSVKAQQRLGVLRGLKEVKATDLQDCMTVLSKIGT